jgi:hypothetical protein
MEPLEYSYHTVLPSDNSQGQGRPKVQILKSLKIALKIK